MAPYVTKDYITSHSPFAKSPTWYTTMPDDSVDLTPYILIDDANPAIQYTGEWIPVSQDQHNASAYYTMNNSPVLNTLHLTSSLNASLTYNFTGKCRKTYRTIHSLKSCRVRCIAYFFRSWNLAEVHPTMLLGWILGKHNPGSNRICEQSSSLSGIWTKR